MKINQNQFPSLGIIFIVLVAISMVFSSVNLVVADVNAVSNSQDFDGVARPGVAALDLGTI